MTLPHAPPAARRPRVLLAAVAAVVVMAPLGHVALPASGAAPAPVLAATAPASAEQAAAGAAATSARRGRRPNVVMVMADDMRVDDLRFAPNVRRLIGGDGLSFANSFSPFPLCCPARASFLTGQYAHNHQVYWHARPYGYGAFDDSRTLATSLRDVGYRTGFVGKYLNGYGTMRSKVSGRRSYTYVPRGWSDWRGAISNPGRNLNPGDQPFPGGTYAYFRTTYNVDGRVDTSHMGEYQSRTIGDYTEDLVRRYHRTPSPFFLYLSYVAPHHGGPSEPDDPMRTRADDAVNEAFKTPARPDWVKGRFDRMVPRAAGMPRGGGPSEPDVSDKPAFFQRLPELTRAEKVALTAVTRQRAESIYVMDRQVGRLVRQLKRTGEWRDTVLMFTSDNGYFLGEHRQRTGKVRAHEPSLRVPFLVTGPGMRQGATRYDPISTVDISATILDLAGARAPRLADGTSRRPTMLHGDRGWSVPVITEARGSAAAPVPPLPTNPDGDPATPPVSARRDPGTLPALTASAYPTKEERRRAKALFGPDEGRSSIGLRTPRWSFSLYRTGEGELYDVLRDPLQEVNRYSDPAFASTVEQLRKVWARYRDCRGAACRTPMAADLQATPAEERWMTARYWRSVRSRFGAGLVLPVPPRPTPTPTPTPETTPTP